MSKLNQKTLEKIKSDVLSILYDHNDEGLFSAQIANNIIRDEDFVQNLMLELEKLHVVKRDKLTRKGSNFIRRKRWRLTEKAFEAYQDLAYPNKD